MTNQTRSLSLTLLALPLLFVACVDESDPPTGELLFGLDDEQVELIHANYLADEDLEQVRAKLTAPFDCTLYADLCEHIGHDAAIELTAQQVEQALAGASLDDIEAELARTLAEASKARLDYEATLSDDEVEGEREGERFRGSGDWAIRTKGDYRLKVRNGVSNPLIGVRTAWTESKLQHQDWTGIWWSAQADEICANTGVNEQYMEMVGTNFNFVVESKDPAKDCIVSDNSFIQDTVHSRLNMGVDADGIWWHFFVIARGCGSAEINGTTLGICAEDYSSGYF